MKRLGRPARACSCFGLGDGARRVVGEQGRDLQGDPAVDAVRRVVDGPEEVGGLRQILDRQLEEQLLARLARLHLLPDGGVVGRGSW